MNKIDSLYGCDVPGCTEYPMLVVTANMKNDSAAFLQVYAETYGGTSVMVPKETGGADFASMLNVSYSGPSFWIEPDRDFTNIIAGGGYHDSMTDSLIEMHGLQPHIHSNGGTQFTLTTTVDSGGTITRSPDAGKYDSATVVTLTAVPDDGYTFSSWSGDLTGTENPITVTMNMAYNVSATFEEIPVNGILMPSGTGNEIVVENDTIFYDNGYLKNYSDNFTGELTLRPSGNTIMEVSFRSFSTESDYDTLFVYDGSSTNSPLIGAFEGDNSPGIVHASTPGGSLTFRFSSDEMTNAAGWIADVRPNQGTAIRDVQLATVSTKTEIRVTGSSLIVSGATGSGTVQLFSVNGRVVRTRKIIGPASINVADLTAGAYVVRVISSNGIISKRLLIGY